MQADGRAAHDQVPGHRAGGSPQLAQVAVIDPGEKAYPLARGIAAVPLARFAEPGSIL